MLINTKGMWSIVGFSIYVYEGIGVLMPIMQASEVPEQFDDILFWAVFTLICLYVSLGLVCNLAYGQMKGIQAITMALPAEDRLVGLVMVLMTA